MPTYTLYAYLATYVHNVSSYNLSEQYNTMQSTCHLAYRDLQSLTVILLLSYRYVKLYCLIYDNNMNSFMILCGT